jgi:hypothetical protein
MLKTIPLLIALCWNIGLVAQNHYWGQQYGGQAPLLGGTAVVGVTDNSAIYYNPGALGFIDSARITASSFVYGMEFIKLKNGAGQGLDLKAIRVTILPQLIAGSIPVKKVPNLKFMVGTFMRSRTIVRLTRESEGYYDVIPGSPGLEYYRARADFSNNFVEQWIGIGMAYKINERFSLGFTSFGTFTHLEVRAFQDLNADAVSNGVPYTATANEYNLIRFDHLTQLFKLGFAARFDHFHLGAAISSPSIRIWGEGKLDKSIEIYNLNKNAVDTTIPAQRSDSYIVSDAQTHLKSYYQIPLSASLGFQLVYPAFKLALSAEYFMGYKNKIIMQGEDHAVVRPSALLGDSVKGFLTLQTTARPVLNIGFGGEVKMTSNLSVLFGVRTDFNNRAEYLPNNTALNIASAKSPMWNYVYFSTGFGYKLAAHNLTTGFDYGLGLPVDHKQIFNFTDPRQLLYLRGPINPNMKTSVHRLNFVLSYIYVLKPKEKKHGVLSIFEELKKSKKQKQAKEKK